MERPGEGPKPRGSNGTATSSFGVSRRESHDASAFYARFKTPELSKADDVVPPYEIQTPFLVGDSRSMPEVRDGSVALVVTSPPYFAGKEYEQDLERGDVPSTYMDYLGLLATVFKECVRKLEPGGRIAVNVANLGRKPYRSLSADIVEILQQLGLLLRGEVIWRKSKAASGNCAWGSFRSAGNPVLRDVTERVLIASKGRFDRAKSRADRERMGLPYQNDLSVDEFMQATTDVWEIDAASAKQVGHPAPFPVELPERLIRLYTYRNDLVLDPFMGAGTTGVASLLWDRRFIGYDLDPKYVELAATRVPMEVERRRSPPAELTGRVAAAYAETKRPLSSPHEFQKRAVEDGKKAQDIAGRMLVDCGFEIIREKYKTGLGVQVNFVARDRSGVDWYFDVSGAFTTERPGLQRSDTLWKTLGRAHVLRVMEIKPVVFLTTDLPGPGRAGYVAMRSVGPAGFFDAMEMYNEFDRERLATYAQGGHDARPLPGYWTPAELDSREG